MSCVYQSITKIPADMEIFRQNAAAECLTRKQPVHAGDLLDDHRRLIVMIVNQTHAGVFVDEMRRISFDEHFAFAKIAHDWQAAPFAAVTRLIRTEYIMILHPEEIVSAWPVWTDVMQFAEDFRNAQNIAELRDSLVVANACAAIQHRTKFKPAA